MFDVILGSIGMNDLLVGPLVIVGKQYGFAEYGAGESRECGWIDGIAKTQMLVVLIDGHIDELSHIFSGEDFIYLCLNAILGRFTAMSNGAGRPTLELALDIIEIGAGFGQIAADPLELPVKKVGIEGDQDGALSSEDRSTNTEGLYVLKIVAGKRCKPAQGDTQQVDALVGS